MTEADKIAEVSEMLAQLRALREDVEFPLRHYFNDACDRLDVLESKLREGLI